MVEVIVHKMHLHELKIYFAFKNKHINIIFEETLAKDHRCRIGRIDEKHYLLNESLLCIAIKNS